MRNWKAWEREMRFNCAQAITKMQELFKLMMFALAIALLWLVHIILRANCRSSELNHHANLDFGL